MQCDRVQPLVPVYLDGELKEELAAPLRRHLLECTECRAVVAETKALAGWFVPTAEIAVPDGFASRVARRAFAGDRGLLIPTPSPAFRAEPSRVARFAMNLVAVAAAALVGLTLLLASEGGRSVGSGGLQATPPSETVLEQLEALNQEPAASDADQVAPAADASPAEDR